MSIRKTYGIIQRSIPPKTRIDSLEASGQVEKYRQFWKPEKTNVVLLAEVHANRKKGVCRRLLYTGNRFCKVCVCSRALTRWNGSMAKSETEKRP